MARTVAAAIIERKFGSVTRKAVASVLGEHASVTDDGEWWTIVGQVRIAAEAEVSERTVWQVLTDFETEGLISRSRRHRKDGTRTSDRIEIHEETVRNLPEAVASRPPADAASRQPEPVASGGRGTTRNSAQGLPAIDDRPTRKAIATQEPSEEPSVEPAAAAAEDLPPIRWAREWAEIRGVVFTKTVRRNWSAQVQEFIAAGGVPTTELMQRAHTQGIREPKAWSYVSGEEATAAERRRVEEWMRSK